MPHNADAQVLQVLCRYVGQNCVVDRVLAESRLIFTKAETSEPGTDINGGALAGHGS